MLKAKTCGAGALAGLGFVTGIIPSEGVPCMDIRLMCAPLPIQMGDMPSEDDPLAPSPSPLTIFTSASASFTGSTNISIRLAGGRY
jgi:hypothetical protein